MKLLHRERHRTEHIGWLRAAVLGANDGIISTASLVVGVAAAQASHASIMTTAVAGLVAGAMSMAAGEYVSVFSQADTEKADLAREHRELTEHPEAEHRELTAIYTRRGIAPALASEVATQLMAHDALGAHARDELGISEASFAVGAVLPLTVVMLTPGPALLAWTIATAIFFLALLGVLAARIGGAPVLKSASRVALWGTLAMAITAGVGAMFGAAP
ncbi:MAG: VIT family protein [Burkholderiaceae bacterium]|nr:MAG: VIT family protein [Burkholderiaceae bacterium]